MLAEIIVIMMIILIMIGLVLMSDHDQNLAMVMLNMQYLRWIRVGCCVERVSTGEAPRAKKCRLTLAAPSLLTILAFHHMISITILKVTCSLLGLEERWDLSGAENWGPGTRTLNETWMIIIIMRTSEPHRHHYHHQDHLDPGL